MRNEATPGLLRIFCAKHALCEAHLFQDQLGPIRHSHTAGLSEARSRSGYSFVICSRIGVLDESCSRPQWDSFPCRSAGLSWCKLVFSIFFRCWQWRIMKLGLAIASKLRNLCWAQLLSTCQRSWYGGFQSWGYS